MSLHNSIFTYVSVSLYLCTSAAAAPLSPFTFEPKMKRKEKEERNYRTTGKQIEPMSAS